MYIHIHTERESEIRYSLLHVLFPRLFPNNIWCMWFVDHPIIWFHHLALMAPPRGLSTPRALTVKKRNGLEICVFLTDSHHILHARSCNHFPCFPHTPKPPRPLKRPKEIIYIIYLYIPYIIHIYLYSWHLISQSRTTLDILRSDSNCNESQTL